MMSKRILELYRQAQVPDTAIDPSNNMPYETTRFSADKFAELILKECLATCSKQAADWEGDYADAHNDGVGSCISGIKEHFGVEWELNDVF